MPRARKFRFAILALVLLSGFALARHWGMISVARWGGQYSGYTIAQDRIVEWQGASSAWHTLYGGSAGSVQIQNGDTWDFQYVDGIQRLRLVNKLGTAPFTESSLEPGISEGGGRYCSSQADGFNVEGYSQGWQVCANGSCISGTDFFVTRISAVSHLMCVNFLQAPPPDL